MKLDSKAKQVKEEQPNRQKKHRIDEYMNVDSYKIIDNEFSNIITNQYY